MSIGRVYCKAGVLNDKLYVVGGLTWVQGGEIVPLQSGEFFDPLTGKWTDLPSMPFSKPRVTLTPFFADILKRIAIAAAGLSCYEGKLYVPQSLFCRAFIVNAGRGKVYDPNSNSWVEMPMGMGKGWPVRHAGKKVGVVVDGDLYALDHSSSLDSAQIKVYDQQDDSWNVIEGDDVHIGDMADSHTKYLLLGFLGKLHVISKRANGDILIMQAHRKSRLDSSVSKNIWKVVATRNCGSAELLSCKIIDI